MQCEYCHRTGTALFRTVVSDDTDVTLWVDVYLCAACRDDLRYCDAKGQIPQDPADA